jgi:ATP-dependent Lon protease
MRKIPIFPLPGVVFFPGTLLPLHIFEPRYRAMVEHALSSERLIGMSMVAPDNADPESLLGNPPLLPLGGAGLIVEHERLEDGRYNILLEGKFRFRIVREDEPGAFRTAVINEATTMPFSSPNEEHAALTAAQDLFEQVRRMIGLPPLPTEPLTAERLSGELALRLRLPSEALQNLLETDSLPERYRAITTRLSEWKEIAGILQPYRQGDANPINN